MRWVVAWREGKQTESRRCLLTIDALVSFSQRRVQMCHINHETPFEQMETLSNVGSLREYGRPRNNTEERSHSPTLSTARYGEEWNCISACLRNNAWSFATPKQDWRRKHFLVPGNDFGRSEGARCPLLPLIWKKKELLKGIMRGKALDMAYWMWQSWI